MARPAGFEPTTPWFVAKHLLSLRIRAPCDRTSLRILHPYLEAITAVDRLLRAHDIAAAGIGVECDARLRQRAALHLAVFAQQDLELTCRLPGGMTIWRVSVQWGVAPLTLTMLTDPPR